MKQEISKTQCGTVEFNVYDNTGEVCVTCKTFPGAWIYCPIYDFIISSMIEFDETGELNGCELYRGKYKG